jgi:hypothetical protein
VQHEGIGVPAELRHDERHSLRHQAGNERHVPREAVELRHEYAALRRTGGGECSCELWPPIQRICAFAGLGLNVLGDNRESFGFGEPLHGRPLRLDAETRALLPLVETRK